MKQSNGFHSRVYDDRPAYADFEPAEKFQAIQSIVLKHLKNHPKAICSYSGGSDSDILIDVVESARRMLDLPPVDYCFFNTGLEMKAIKDHVKDIAEKYGVDIKTIRPEVNIVTATRRYGIPFVSKIVSSAMDVVQRKNVPMSIKIEYDQAEDKAAKRQELRERYPNAETAINFICCCNSAGEPRPDIQLVINSSKYLWDYMMEHPMPFKCSAKCCDYCKKQAAHKVQKDYEMIITGERRDEGGMRSVPRQGEANKTMCFSETANGQFRLRPLYYVSDKDKEWYKERHGLKYSDAYEVYGLKRTGCCGCPISYRAVDDLELIGKYEPNVAKAAWAIFGDSYRYRQAYYDFKKQKMSDEKYLGKNQINVFDVLSEGCR